MSLLAWVNICIQNQKILETKSNTNKSFDQQKEINNLMFLEELILIIQDEIIFRNIQNYFSEKLRTDIQILEEKLSEEQKNKNIQNENYNQQLLINQQILQSLQIQYQKALTELNAVRAKLNEQLYNLNNKINLYQSGINKLNKRLNDNLSRVVSDYNAQNNLRDFRIEDNIVKINFDNTYKYIINDVNDKYSKNENFDFKELALERIRKTLYESLGAKLTYLDQRGLDEIEKIAQDEYTRFESFLNKHGSGQSFFRDFESRNKAVVRLDSLVLQRDNVTNLLRRATDVSTSLENIGNAALEGNDIKNTTAVVQRTESQVHNIIQDYNSAITSEPTEETDELAALMAELESEPDAQPNDNINNQQEQAVEAQSENPELENPEEQPAPPGGMPVADVAGPPGGPPIQNEEEAPAPEPELPPLANEIKPQPAEVKPVSSTLAALSKLGISKEQILEKKEVDKKREEEAKKAEPQAKDQSQGSSQRKPESPDQSGPKIGRKF